LSTAAINFVRDRFTWLGYITLGYYSYMQASLGPLIVFVRAELNLDYTQGGLHLSAFALGMITAGLFADRFARRFGRRLTFWGGGAGLALGGILLTLGQTPVVTIGGALVMGVIGSFTLVMVQAALADHHGARRAFALTEANVLASLTAALAPIAVGFGESSGIGWRLALYIGTACWLLMFFTSYRVPLPASPQSTPSYEGEKGEVSSRRKLPFAFWAYWLVVFLSVSVEWCMIFWAADFLEKIAGLSKDAAASTVSLFFIAAVIGRAVGSRLTRTTDSGRLLLIAGGIVLIGFPLFWLSRTPILNVAGLFICGLGIANLFPLTLSAASNVAAEQANTASARIALAAGTAILITPQLLGTIADSYGIQSAYAITVPIIIAVLVVTYFANRFARRA